MIRIKSLRQTCWASPSQWEALTVDDRPVYIRYRHGELSVRVGPVHGSIDDAIRAVPVFDDDAGEQHGCQMDWEEVLEATGIEMATP